MSEFHSAFSPLPNASITVCPLERWALPQFPFLKLNVDGAVNLHNGTRGLGAVLRNERGELLLAVCKGMFGHFSRKATEIYVAALGLQAIFYVGFHLDNIILEMDAQTVVHDLLSTNHDWSVEGALLEEVKTFFRFFNSVICTYTPRKCNRAAHVLARNALLFPAFQVWIEEGPQWLSDVLIADVNGSVA
ncbi:hypothetical protein M0R45_013912 [Rubus argutus]|uniref:RNase H type-1 domain-containing protein n=1 Tax=Rubus argutus TaxID=59490 RepID=A0AAW1XJU6_RUBAR